MGQKLSAEELQQFQDVRKSIYETIGILGDLNYRKTLIDFEIERLNEEIKKNAAQERELLKQLGEKYGTGSINVETGEITPLP